VAHGVRQADSQVAGATNPMTALKNWQEGQICSHLTMLTGKRVKGVRSEQIWLSPVCKERIIVVAFATCKADC